MKGRAGSEIRDAERETKLVPEEIEFVLKEFE
jgi:hypothetical protein